MIERREPGHWVRVQAPHSGGQRPHRDQKCMDMLYTGLIAGSTVVSALETFVFPCWHS